jgi:hypothetical protein
MSSYSNYLGSKRCYNNQGYKFAVGSVGSQGPQGPQGSSPFILQIILMVQLDILV